MGAIFLSYAREDRAFVERLARVLEQAGHDVWWDRHIDGGEEFATEIEQALDKADAVLVAWSQLSVQSRWVRDEAAVGGDSGRLVPLTIDGSRPPMGFRQFHTLDLSGWKGSSRDDRTEELLRSVDRRLQSNDGSQAVRPQHKPKPRRALVWVDHRWAIAAIAAAILVIAAVVIFRTPSSKSPSTPSVALLPFTAESSDADARKLAIASHAAVAHTLSQGAFAVSTIDALPADGRPPADFLISGQVTATPDKVIANVRMEETDYHVVVFSHQFEAVREKAWSLPEQVGAQVASQLSWTAPIIAMERRHPSDPSVTASLLQSSTAGLEGTDVLHDFETARRNLAKAPNSPLAQNNFAFSTAFALDQIPRSERAEAVTAARRAVERTIELAPEYGGGYIPWCLLHSEVRRIECENRLRTAMRADPDGPFNNFFLAQLLNTAGRNREASELAALSLAHDPYMPYKIALMLRMFEIGGRTEESDKLYRQSIRWWPDNPVIAHFRLTGMIQRGDFEAARRFGVEAEPHPDAGKMLPANAHKSAGELQRACAKDAVDLKAIMCMLELARLGQLDGAFAIAARIFPPRLGRTPEEEDRIWLDNPSVYSVVYLTAPAAAPLRRDPRFLTLASQVGLLDYWRSGRLPDFCGQPREPVCARIGARR